MNGFRKNEDTRMELHILNYELRMASIRKDAISQYTHYLIKICLLPHSRPGFFSFTETKDDYSVYMEEKEFLEFPKSESLTFSDSLWSVLTVCAGAMGNHESCGISKILNSIVLPLADEGISLFLASTYHGDFILVKNKDLAKAIQCLSSSFKIYKERIGNSHEGPKLLNETSIELNNVQQKIYKCNRPLIHDFNSPLNNFHVISLNNQFFSSLIPTLIDLMFYSSTRNAPKPGYETFFHFSFIDGDVSVVLDEEALSRIPSQYIYTSSLREQWRVIKIGAYPLGFDECGIVAQIAEPLVDAKITTFYISSCHLGHTLVPKEDIIQAVDVLNERKKQQTIME